MFYIFAMGMSNYNSIQIVVYDLLTTSSNKENISLALASELLENLEEMFSPYYMHSDDCNKMKSNNSKLPVAKWLNH